MKDPLNTTETPYEVLGIAENTPPRMILAALGKCQQQRMRQRTDVKKCVEARALLQNAKSRIEEDILHYAFGSLDTALARPSPPFSVTDACPIPPGGAVLACTDLDRDDFSHDVRTVTPHGTSFTDDSTFAKLRDEEFEGDFDR